MKNIGFTDVEQKELERIDDIKNSEKKEEAVRKFEASTGKKFPGVVYRLNVDTMDLGCTNGDAAFEMWFAEESWKDLRRR